MDLMQYSVETLKKGYFYDEDNNQFVCIYCGSKFDKNEIFSIEDRFFNAKYKMAHHIKEVHGSPSNYLIALDKKSIGLTDYQKLLVTDMANGLTDKEIAIKHEITQITVRNLRFTLKEKAKQAKAYLALYESIFQEASEFAPVHNHATMVDDRYIVTIDEKERILKSAFESLSPLKLKVFSSKEKKKLVVLTKIAESFELDQDYDELEINQQLKSIYSDFATIRRYLIEYGFMERSKDGRSYKRKN
ncbi:MAG: hypothetical protein BGO41_05240 [Clostridiales bacterium 38-18]|nr:MAG: hypothetical protein BGO41_05240 [Clostridiales bacterium 38-18]